MEPHVVHPSVKPACFWYAAAALIVAAGVYVRTEYMQNSPAWIVCVPALLFLVPIQKHFATRLTKMTITATRLTLESGLLSRFTRTVDLLKIQDVAVRQTLGQRILGVGDLSLETAGETSMLGMHNVDRPREVADLILAGSARPNPGWHATGA